MIHNNIKHKEFWIKVQEEYSSCEEDETYFWLCERSPLFKEEWQDDSFCGEIRQLATGFLSQFPESYEDLTVGSGLLFTSKSMTVGIELKRQVRLDFLKYMIDTTPSFWEVVKQEYKGAEEKYPCSPFICDNSPTFRKEWETSTSEIYQHAILFIKTTKKPVYVVQDTGALFTIRSSKLRIQFLEYMTRKPKEKFWIRIKRFVYETFKNI